MTIPVLSYKPAGSGVRVDLDRLVASRMLVQANSGGGKSRAIRQLLEETHGRVMHLVIDPEGEFVTLRERFDYIIAAKTGGDAIASPKYAKRLCRTLVELNASAILDLYDLSLDDRRWYVENFLTELMALPRDLWRPIVVVIDEMHLFAPEAGQARSADAVTALATQGRKRGFCLVGATQRISKLHKDVAAELLNKMIGRTGLDIDVKRAGDELGMGKEERNALKTLAPGEFFVYGPAISNEVVRVTTGDVVTSHPEAGRIGAMTPPPSAKVKAMLAKLADLPKEAEEEALTIEALRRELASTRAQLTKAQKAQGTPIVDEKAIERAVAASQRQYMITIQKLRAALEECVNFVIRVTAKEFEGAGIDKAELEQAVSSAVAKAMELVDRKVGARTKEVNDLRREAERISARAKKIADESGEPISIDVTVSRSTPFVATETSRALAQRPVASNGHARSRTQTEPADGITAPQQRILNALAGFESMGVASVDRSIAAVFSNQSPTSSGYGNNLGRLRTLGYIDYPAGGTVQLTDAGRAIAAGLEINSVDELHSAWEKQLPSPQWNILAPLIENGQNGAIERTTLAQRAGQSPTSSGYGNNLGRLRSLGLINYKKGEDKETLVYPTNLLFPDGLR